MPKRATDSCTYKGADLAGQSKGGVLAVVDTLFVEVANVELDTGVVLGGDELVAPSAA